MIQPLNSKGSAIWHATLFGKFSVSNSRETHTRFESKRAIALIAYLILYPQGQTREALADRLWPEADLATARNRLKQTLAGVRRLLEPPSLERGSVLVADRESISLRPGALSSDYQEFLAAHQAKDEPTILRISQSEFLPGIYDEWLDDIRLWIESSASERSFEPSFAHPLIPSHEAGSSRSAQNINVPIRVTSFFGRESETETVLQLLRDYRAVTITGMGGIGKTRLTLNVAARASQSNISFVSLAEVEDPAQLLPTILNTLGGTPAKTMSPLETLAQLIKGDDHLLILDNLEQLAGSESAQVLGSFLEACPSIRILASSRVPLDIEGEAEFPLFPLSVPTASQTLGEVSESAVARLFIDRARQARADFQITERNREQLTQLFEKLDGVPLSVELCAAWSHVLTPSQMVEKLEREGSLLVTKRKDVPERHRSLSNAFITTTSLLSERQRELLIQLSVFRGGWSIELLQGVVRQTDLLDVLSDLMRAALIRSETTGGSMRFSMLESLRQHASSLPDAGDLKAQVQVSTLNVMLELSKRTLQCEPFAEFGIASESDWIRFWRAEWDNLRAAISFGISVGKLDDVTELIRNTDWLWRMFSKESEVASWVKQVLDRWPNSSPAKLKAQIIWYLCGDTKGAEKLIELLPQTEDSEPALRVFHLFTICNMLSFSRNWGLIETYASEAIPLALEMGDFRMAGKCHHSIGIGFQLQNKPDESIHHFDKAEEYIRKAGRTHDLMYVLYDRAFRATQLGENQTAIMILQEVIGREDQTGDLRLMGRCYNSLGITYTRERRWTEAFQAQVKSVNLYAQAQDHQGILYPLWNTGLALISLDQYMVGVIVLSYSVQLWEVGLGFELTESEKEYVDNAYAMADEAVGKELRLALVRKGKSMSTSEVNSFMLDSLERGLLKFPDGTVAKF